MRHTVLFLLFGSLIGLTQASCSGEDSPPAENNTASGGTGGTTGPGGAGNTGGAADTGGTTGSGGSEPVDPVTGLPLVWENRFEIEEGDYVTMLDHGSLIISRPDFTDGFAFDFFYSTPDDINFSTVAEGEPGLNPIGEDLKYVYFRNKDGANHGIERAEKLDMGADGVSLGTLTQLVSDGGADAIPVFAGHGTDNAFFTYTNNAAESQELYGFGHDGLQFLQEATGGPGSVRALVVLSDEVRYYDDNVTIMSLALTGGAPTVAFDLPEMCGSVRRNPTRDGWYALCEGVSGRELVNIAPDGTQETLVTDVSLSSFFQVYDGDFIVTRDDGAIDAYHTTTNQKYGANLNQLEYVGVYGGKVFAYAPTMLVSADLVELFGL